MSPGVSGIRANAATQATESPEPTIQPLRRDRLGGGELSCRFWRLFYCPASTALGAASIPSPGDRSDDGDDTTLRRFGFVRLLRPVTALTGEVTGEADHQNLPATLFS